jgi:hypothetical protein
MAKKKYRFDFQSLLLVHNEKSRVLSVIHWLKKDLKFSMIGISNTR